MRRQLLQHFDPKLNIKAIGLQTLIQEGDHVIEGVLQSAGGSWQPIGCGVPCFGTGPAVPDRREFATRHGLPLPDNTGPVAGSADVPTITTFSDKWRRFSKYGLDPAERDFLLGWYCKKLGMPDVESLAAFYRDNKLILEVGPAPDSTRDLSQNNVKVLSLQPTFPRGRSRPSRTPGICRIAMSFKPI